ncbi:Nucleotidyl transferase AbiEii toxin, Type IV TA system [Thermomonospora echinospora]|uniref:Nucleotidyl transferase AbiEii toxin, Type IV TA system n=1 Tax=Thermomonospora echinospora TaxID=1992 RepID=A0A1H6CHS9_9ACTN|nr:nucleotidyl transferase AbiEii/AbiGii toxin family protein [Thermomonospora echinospora]SEG72462.1 Nucleotidyl transferase AbiEii toxin, Type IV TA system [Thermomonospora echinospora]
MDTLHELATRIGLTATEKYGFALAGGYAIQAHGFLDRISEDVDLFTVNEARDQFGEAVAAATAAYRSAGFDVEVPLSNDGFARLLITTPDGHSVKVELGIDWRAHPPVGLSVGPVLHPDDAVGNKVAALYGRAEVRDFVDVDAVLRSGRYSTGDLLRLAATADPGFEPEMFVHALNALDRLPDQAFGVHGLSPSQIAELRNRFKTWAAEITG